MTILSDDVDESTIDNAKNKQTEDDDQVPPQSSSQLLIHNPILMAEILSLVLTNTKEFARLRQVCKLWKNEILPYFLEHHSHHYLPTIITITDDYGIRQTPSALFLRVCYDYGHDSDTTGEVLSNNDTEFIAPTHRLFLAAQRYHNSPKKFLPALVHLANQYRFAGKRYGGLDVWQDLILWDHHTSSSSSSSRQHTLDFWESVSIKNTHHGGEKRGRGEDGREDISVQSLLIVCDAIPSTYCIFPSQRVTFGDDDDDDQNHNDFASLCQALVQTDSWPQFCSLGEEALNEGMFLSMEDYNDTMTKASAVSEDESCFAFESRIVPVIFTVRFRLLDQEEEAPSSDSEHASDSQDSAPNPKEVCFKVRIPKPPLDDDSDNDDNESEGSCRNHEVDNTTDTADQNASVGGDALTPTLNQSIVPFVKYLSLSDGNGNDNRDDQRYAYATFKGYNVQPIILDQFRDHGDIHHGDKEAEANEPKTLPQHYYTCHVPMSFAWWELMQLLVPEESDNNDRQDAAENNNSGLEDQGADSFLPLEWLWRTCQEKSVQEGVGIMDGILLFAGSNSDRHTQLVQQLDALAGNVASATTANRPSIVHNLSFRQWQERRPQEQQPSTHRMAGRIALVDPDLYSYSELHSTLELSVWDVPPCSFPYSHHLDPPILQTVDYWGRSYNGSLEYQWLPTYFDVDPDGKSTTIRDYINNLVPRSEYAALYDSLAHLFSLAVPLLESVYSYCRVVKRSHVRMVESNQQTWHPSPPSPLKVEPTLLRGQSLQVITEIEEYDLNATHKNTATGMQESWHVKGMPHEEIVATVMYVLPTDEHHHGSMGTIQFRRAFFNDEANYLFSTIDRDRSSEVEADIHAGLLPLGQSDILPGRLLVFPNCHVSKMNVFKQATADCPTNKLRLIVFYLVNPEKRIISTREVRTQQGFVPAGTISPEQARVHRTELQRERERTIPDWNVRQIQLL
ncbi:unnamed protein product [Cylindrotheca closterium]|uniref:DUF4246 domain-containing protein n=1 Tax=Cylindrotheca closterium TaxID=2856 RepID=A0AAD2FHT1_9STRA|nr:unnamed protein product [Cylindrotheca closterium]